MRSGRRRRSGGAASRSSGSRAGRSPSRSSLVAGLIGLILYNGLGFFWPQDVARLTLADGAGDDRPGGGARADPRQGRRNTASSSRSPTAISTARTSSGWTRAQIADARLSARRRRDRAHGVGPADRHDRGGARGRRGARDGPAGGAGRCSGGGCPRRRGSGARSAHRDAARSARSTTRRSSSGSGLRRLELQGHHAAVPRWRRSSASWRALQARYRRQEARLAELRKRAGGEPRGDGRRRQGEGAAARPGGRRVLPQRHGPAGQDRGTTRPGLGVRGRRPARVEHRGRRVPGHLRHRDDGADHEHPGDARSACSPPSTCASTPSRGRS